PIVRDLHARWQAPASLLVAEVVGQVHQISATWLDLGDDRQGLVERQMHRVRTLAQGVDDQHVCVAHRVERSGWHALGVGEIRQIAETEAVHGPAAVWYLERHDLNAVRLEWPVEDVDAQIRLATVE